MKKCKECNVELNNITQSPSMIKNYISRCRKCHSSFTRQHRIVNRKKNYEKEKEYDRQHYLKNVEKKKKYVSNWQKSKEDGFIYVYMKKDNYVGATKNLYRHAIEHKALFLCILHKTSCEYEASELENLLHDMGYKGKHPQNLPYWACI